MRTFFRRAICLVLASVAIYTPACGDDDDGTTHETPADPSTSDVVFPEDEGDEALQVMLAASATADTAKAAVLTSPTAGAQLPRATPPTFTWALPATGTYSPRQRVPRDQAPSPRLLGPPRSARAHGDAVNGTAYFLVFSTAGNDKLLRVFTTKTTYQPDDAAWATLTGAQGPIKAELLTAVFDNNNLAPGGGPFTSSTSFSVAP